MNFEKFLKTPFLIEHFRCLLQLTSLKLRKKIKSDLLVKTNQVHPSKNRFSLSNSYKIEVVTSLIEMLVTKLLLPDQI